MSYLNMCSNHLAKSALDIVREKLIALISSTNGNITVLIWLGIIDIHKFIEFIINDDEIKQKLKPFDKKIQDNNLKVNHLEREIQEIIKKEKKVNEELKGVLKKIPKSKKDKF